MRFRDIRNHIRAIAECPDCDSVVTVDLTPAGDPTHVQVLHDDTCPWLASLERAGGTQVRLINGNGKVTIWTPR